MGPKPGTITAGRRVTLAAACAAAVVSLAGASSNAADYTHPTVVKDTAVSWTPHIAVTDGVRKPVAYSIDEAGDYMVVGGTFDTVESANRQVQFPRHNVFAFDATDGTVLQSFAPVLDGPVWSVLSDGTSVYIGGGFTTVDGVSRPALAKLDLMTGALDPNFRPPFTGGRISDLELRGDQLVIAGTISRRLMAVNPTTGKPTSFISNTVGGRLANSNSAQVFKFDISPDGQHLVAVGNFTTVDGQPRPRVFMLNLAGTGSTLSSWNYDPLALNCTSSRTNAQAYVQDVDFSPDGSYFALAAFGYMFQPGYRFIMLCDSVSRFETNDLDPTHPTWINYTGGDSLKSVAVTGAAVYVQGHSRWLDNPYGQDFPNTGAVDRLGGGAVDPATGNALSWNPVMPQQSGGYQILPSATGVWFVTDGSRFGGKYHRGIRFAELP